MREKMEGRQGILKDVVPESVRKLKWKWEQ